MARTRVVAGRRWLGLAGIAAGSLALGVAVGASLPGRTVYREAALGAVAVPPGSFAGVVSQVASGVVAVRAHFAGDVARVDDGAQNGRRAVFEPTPGFRNGSGFVVNRKGLVVTSRHVVAGAADITVELPNDRAVRATVVGEDVATDLALLRLAEPPAGLPELALGRSEELRAGDWIVAVGNPFGFAQTVTAGVVSFVGRHLPHSDLRVTNDLIQFSAPVNPGSSGCPLFDTAGNVVGVTTQAATDAQGISFAVPSRTLKWVLEAMAQSPDGKVHRGYLGVEFLSYSETDAGGAPRRGARIVGVVEGAPAARAGIRTGDVVVEIDGVGVTDARSMHERIVQGEPGGRIALHVVRGGHLEGPIDAVLGEMESARPETSPWN